MLNIAMISGWHVHATGYAKEVNESGVAQVTTIWDEIPERGEKWASEIGAKFVSCIDEVLADASIDGVLICAPTNMHKDIMLKAAKAKKHIFTEKVMALSCNDAQEIADAVKANGVKFCISYPHRTMPHNLFAKKAIEEGYIGKPTLVRIRNAHNGKVGDWLPAHFYDKDQCGGGAMIDLGAHGMYLSHWLLGKPISIMSMFTNVMDTPVEDNAVCVIEFENGAIAINETGFVTPASPFSLEVYATEGSVMICDGKVKIKSSKITGDTAGWLNVESLPNALDNAILSWLKAINGEDSIVFGMEDAIALTELMQRAYESHDQGKKIMF